MGPGYTIIGALNAGVKGHEGRQERVEVIAVVLPILNECFTAGGSLARGCIVFVGLVASILTCRPQAVGEGVPVTAIVQRLGD